MSQFMKIHGCSPGLCKTADSGPSLARLGSLPAGLVIKGGRSLLKVLHFCLMEALLSE